MTRVMPKVSVIIPTYNAEKDIERCLRSIRRQTYKNTEIILVDQSSDDRTLDIARRYTKKIITREQPQFYSPPSLSRNMGAKASKGRFLLSIDADMEPHPKLIENCVKLMKEQRFVALIIHEKDIALNFWAKCRALEKECMILDPYMEAARFFSKKSFSAIGGYDAALGSGEDWDLNARLKAVGKIGYADYPIFHHTGRKDFTGNFGKMINYGKTFDAYIKKHPKLARKQLTPFREMYFRNWKLLAQHPILTAGLFLLKFSEFTGASIGLVASRSRND